MRAINIFEEVVCGGEFDDVLMLNGNEGER